jgi:hypothetical protein
LNDRASPLWTSASSPTRITSSAERPNTSSVRPTTALMRCEALSHSHTTIGSDSATASIRIDARLIRACLRTDPDTNTGRNTAATTSIWSPASWCWNRATTPIEATDQPAIAMVHLGGRNDTAPPRTSIWNSNAAGQITGSIAAAAVPVVTAIMSSQPVGLGTPVSERARKCAAPAPMPTSNAASGPLGPATGKVASATANTATTARRARNCTRSNCARRSEVTDEWCATGADVDAIAARAVNSYSEVRSMKGTSAPTPTQLEGFSPLS